MAKTLRTLTDADFTTKGSTLTFEELDQNFIDIWNEIVDNQRLDDLTPTDGNFVVGNGSAWVAESGATARASLGVTIGSDVQAWDAQLDTLSTLTAGQAADIVAITEAEYTQLQNIDSSTISTTQWGYVGAMDQGVATTDAVNFITVNTGQGDNELYAMNQDVQTTDDVAFNLIDLATTLELDDTNGKVVSDTFLSGFSGSGIQLDKTAGGNWELTVDDLIVRRLARFYEIVVERIRANAGTLIVSPGAEKIVSLDDTLSDATWTFNDTITPFASPAPDPYYAFARHYEAFIEEDKLITLAEDDLLRRQEWNGRGTGVTEATVFAVEGGDPDPEVNTTARSFTFFIEADSDVPAVGQEYAVIGNQTDPDRQGLILFTSSDTDAPYRRIFSGIDSHDKFGDVSTLKNQDGRLDGIDVSSQFAELDGTQNNLFGSYWDGNVYINDGNFRGTVTITDEANSNAATKDYADSASEGNVVIRSASAPTQRPGGSDIQEGDQWIDIDDGEKPYTYDGTDPFTVSGWIQDYTIIDGGDLQTGTVTLAKLNFTALTSSGGTNEIIGTINASSEGIDISADRISIDGTTTFLDSDYNPTNKTAKADGIAIIEQASTPTQRPSGDALQSGDVWVDTDDSNKRYEYNGSTFVRDYTIIDGGSIETGTVTATQIDVADLFATTANITGTFTIASGGTFSSTPLTLTDTLFDLNVTNLRIKSDTEILRVGPSSGYVFRVDGGANTGEIAGFTLNGNNETLYTGDGTNGYVGMGATAGATERAFWAGAPNTDGSGDASYYVQQNGKIFYDGLTQPVRMPENLANFSDEASSASMPAAQEFTTTASVSGVQDDTEQRDIIVASFQKRFRIDSITVVFYAKYDLTETPDSGSYVESAYVEAGIDGTAISSQVNIGGGLSSGAYTKETLTLDISSLTEGEIYDFYVEQFSELLGDSSGTAQAGDSGTLILYTRNDLVAYGTP